MILKLGFLAGPIGLAVHGQIVRVAGETVDGALGADRVGEGGEPLVGTAVGGDDHRAGTVALGWALGEFLFGFNQETGFRGLIMTGLLRLGGWKPAVALNTLLFLVGPLHGLGPLESWQQHPVAMGGYAAGVLVCGLSFSWLRYRTDNVVLCAVLHGIINGPMNGAALVLRAHPIG